MLQWVCAVYHLWPSICHSLVRESQSVVLLVYFSMIPLASLWVHRPCFLGTWGILFQGYVRVCGIKYSLSDFILKPGIIIFSSTTGPEEGVISLSLSLSLYFSCKHIYTHTHIQTHACMQSNAHSPVKALSVLMEGNFRVISCLCLWIIRWASVWKLCPPPGERQTTTWAHLSGERREQEMGLLSACGQTWEQAGALHT